MHVVMSLAMDSMFLNWDQICSQKHYILRIYIQTKNKLCVFKIDVEIPECLRNVN